tara:strand:- start:602 stop:1318 length:717 start_codon:yes stop_codon:yes gene_type:complete
MEPNIPNNAKNSISTMSAAFDDQNTLMDSVIDKMYNYDIYGRYGDPTIVPSLDLSGILSENTQTQSAMLDALSKDATRLSKTYNYTSEEYYNQALANQRVQSEKDTVQQRYDLVVGEIVTNQRQHEIYQYQYYKQKAQLSLLYYFILMILFFIVITYLNNHFTFVMNNALYTILIGTSLAVYVIYTGYRIYDIVLRSDFVFNEYDTSPWTNPSSSKNNSAPDSGSSSSDGTSAKCSTS